MLPFSHEQFLGVFAHYNRAIWPAQVLAYALGLALAALVLSRRRRAGRWVAAGPTWRTSLGWLLIAYSALLYPALGAATGMSYPAVPVFGVAPCPVTLFTWGILLLAKRVPWWLVPIPFAWALVGGSAAFLLRVPQDWILLASPLCGLLLPGDNRFIRQG